MSRSSVDWLYVRNIFLFVLLIFSILFIATFIHELVHASIYESYGCSHNIYFTWEGGRTASMCPLTLGMDKLVALEVEQQRVEDVSYILFPVGMSIITVLLFFWFRKKDWL